MLQVYAYFMTKEEASDPRRSPLLLQERVGSLSSGFALSSLVFGMAVVACLIVVNSLSAWSHRLANLADMALSVMSSCGAALALTVLFTMTLLFLIAALLDPMTALQPMIVGAAGVGLVASMWGQFAQLTKGILQVIESQLDIVLNTVLDNLINRLGLDSNMENLALGSDYTQEDSTCFLPLLTGFALRALGASGLHVGCSLLRSPIAQDLNFAFQKADQRFRGLDAEGEPLKETCKCIHKDPFVDEIAKLLASQGLQQSSSSGDDLASKGLDLPVERRNQLAQLFQYYLQKTPLDEDVQWRIFEECEALTNVMIQEHQNRLEVLDFPGVPHFVNSSGPVAAPAGNKASMAQPGKQPESQLPKAYLIYRSIYRDNIDKFADLIVQWADPLLHWDTMVEKVTKFYDDAVPKYVRSCAVNTFNPNIRDSVTQKVLAGVCQHVEGIATANATATITLDELIRALQGQAAWASGLLECAQSQDFYHEATAKAFIKEQVKQVVPEYRSMAPHIPIYKIPAAPWQRSSHRPSR